jgi:hypothetical protein
MKVNKLSASLMAEFDLVVRAKQQEDLDLELRHHMEPGRRQQL